MGLDIAAEEIFHKKAISPILTEKEKQAMLYSHSINSKGYLLMSNVKSK